MSSELRYIHGGLADLLYLLIAVIDPNALSRAKVKKMQKLAGIMISLRS